MNALLLVMLLAVPTADPEPRESDLVRAWLKVSQQHAQDYMIHPEGKPDRAFTMLPHAVFRHSQPVRGDDIGAVYLWVDPDQRPAAIGTTFAFTLQDDLRSVVHEFHSLASGPITANWRGKPRWQPTQAGLQFQPVPLVPKPATDLKLRQRQVRDIARRFTANSTDHQQKRWELRLVSKPIHQFDMANPKDTLGGALFIFCQGTDPELVLAIEAQQQDGVYQWFFAPASFTDFGLKLRLDDKEVWIADPQSFGRTQTHWVEPVSKERLPIENR